MTDFGLDLLLRARESSIPDDPRISSHVRMARDMGVEPKGTRLYEKQNEGEEWKNDPQSPQAQSRRSFARKYSRGRDIPMISGDEEYEARGGYKTQDMHTGEMKDMKKEDTIIAKMDPMARRALAATEGLQKAIEAQDTDAIKAHITAAENALSMLKSDLALHDQLTKAMSRTTPADRFMGVIPQYDNNASDYNGTENAVAMGVSRHGRSTGFFTPHRIV